MNAIAARMRSRVNDDRGISLAELIVAVLLFGILSTLVIGTFISISRTFTLTRSGTDSANVASVGMNEVTRVIRSGTEIQVLNQTLNEPVFLAASNESVTLYAYLDTSSIDPYPIKVQFSINANRELVETRWPSSKVGGYFTFPTSTPTSVKTVARQIMTRATGEKYLFSYVLADGSILAVPTAGFTKEQLRSIVAVQVTMKVQADNSSRAAPVTLQNTVGIPNLGISRVG